MAAGVSNQAWDSAPQGGGGVAFTGSHLAWLQALHPNSNLQFCNPNPNPNPTPNPNPDPNPNPSSNPKLSFSSRLPSYASPDANAGRGRGLHSDPTLDRIPNPSLRGILLSQCMLSLGTLLGGLP